MLWGIKNREEGSRGLGGLGVIIVNRVMREGVTEKVTFDICRAKGSEPFNDVSKQHILNRRNSRCKCPEVGLCFRDSREG